MDFFGAAPLPNNDLGLVVDDGRERSVGLFFLSLVVVVVVVEVVADVDVDDDVVGSVVVDWARLLVFASLLPAVADSGRSTGGLVMVVVVVVVDWGGCGGLLSTTF